MIIVIVCFLYYAYLLIVLHKVVFNICVLNTLLLNVVNVLLEIYMVWKLIQLTVCYEQSLE